MNIKLLKNLFFSLLVQAVLYIRQCRVSYRNVLSSLQRFSQCLAQGHFNRVQNLLRNLCCLLDCLLYCQERLKI